MESTSTDNREFYKVDLPSYPLQDSTKICITQLSSETSIQTWPCAYRRGDEIITHTYYEEVYILQGSITDLSLNETFGKEYHAWRNPGMKHGPYQADLNLGCQMIVIIRNSNQSK
jgi:hypothetical protein